LNLNISTHSPTMTSLASIIANHCTPTHSHITQQQQLHSKLVGFSSLLLPSFRLSYLISRTFCSNVLLWYLLQGVCSAFKPMLWQDSEYGQTFYSLSHYGLTGPNNLGYELYHIMVTVI
jgi:hypothetical protein